jgi:hypothetical protein
MNFYNYYFSEKIPDWLNPYQNILDQNFRPLKSLDSTQSFLKIQNQKLIWQDSEMGDFEIENFQTNKGPKILKGKNELLAKALDFRKTGDLILDATLGLGKDSRLLIELGAKIIGCEQNPLVFLLLQSARNCGTEKVKENLEIYWCDSQRFISDFKSEKPYCIYLDPMFEGPKGSAKPKKSMQIFRRLNLESDLNALVKVALASSARRVVVKQPIKSKEHSLNVIHSYQGKSIRYDLISKPG